MGIKRIEVAVCDCCYLESEMASGVKPDGWTRWEDRDICPSCRAAILRFLFDRGRVTACIATQGHGHADEQRAFAATG